METLKRYQPLLVVFLLAVIMAVSIQLPNTKAVVGGPATTAMGFFLCLLSMFKFFNLSGFADGFQMYDVVATRFRPYAYAYPFIELCLGLSFLANWAPLVTNTVTIVVMSVSAIGVVGSVQSGMNVRCACLGTVLNVPLSTVSIVENVGMGLMATVNIARLVLA